MVISLLSLRSRSYSAYCFFSEEFVVEPSSEKSRSADGENDKQTNKEGAEPVTEDVEEEESTVEVSSSH